MKDKTITDDILYEVIPEIVEESVIPQDDEVNFEYEFSSDFEKNINRIERKVKRRESKIYIYTGRVAVCLVLLLVGAFTITMSVTAFREKVFETIKMYTSDSVDYSFNVEEESLEIEYIYPGQIPAGYEMIESVESPNALFAVYKDSKEDSFIWEQTLISNSTKMIMDTEYEECKEVSTRGHTYTLYKFKQGTKMAYMEIGK
ncbi:MAG: DUF4367 domain-containing protein, partial [Lachnospiraceae bacterium]|nr:DUF4367 domain-containing protein [Lachnospiraceae bacterium]